MLRLQLLLASNIVYAGFAVVGVFSTATSCYNVESSIAAGRVADCTPGSRQEGRVLPLFGLSIIGIHSPSLVGVRAAPDAYRVTLIFSIFCTLVSACLPDQDVHCCKLVFMSFDAALVGVRALINPIGPTNFTTFAWGLLLSSETLISLLKVNNCWSLYNSSAWQNKEVIYATVFAVLCFSRSVTWLTSNDDCTSEFSAESSSRRLAFATVASKASQARYLSESGRFQERWWACYCRKYETVFLCFRNLNFSLECMLSRRQLSSFFINSYDCIVNIM